MPKIYLIRNKKVMLDKDLASLYGVQTGNLNKSVSRNGKRFPEDFMFQLTEREFKNLMFLFGTSSWGGTRKMPYAFTGQGVAMLSSVIKSDRAILVNIHIIRVFTRLRQMLMSNKEMLLKLEQLESSVGKHGDDIKVIFQYLREMFNSGSGAARKIGFKQNSQAG